MTSSNVDDKLHFRQIGCTIFSSIAHPIKGGEGMLTAQLKRGFGSDNFLIEFMYIATKIKGVSKMSNLITKN